MYLIPGDSPMGYRLPLDSLPWVSDGDALSIHPQDPTAPRGLLPAYDAFRARAEPRLRLPGHALDADREAAPARPGHAPDMDREAAPARFVSAAGSVRTALCVEPRDGVLHVFMPPLATLEDYLDLLAAVEATAADLRMPVVLEGYQPPDDPRLASLHDHSRSRRDRSEHPPGRTAGTSSSSAPPPLYEDARHTRLATEKFMLDGRHTGTGGGNHIVLGGPTPADSPFLRRPDLLRSLLAYWHNHPSLSYLFSGLFIGPTSQAPRVDEARRR